MFFGRGVSKHVQIEVGLDVQQRPDQGNGTRLRSPAGQIRFFGKGPDDYHSHTLTFGLPRFRTTPKVTKHPPGLDARPLP